MSKEYIDREALKEDLKESYNSLKMIYDSLAYGEHKLLCERELMAFIEAILRVKDAPAADVVEVVRCKDCKYWMGQAYAYRCKRHSYLNYHTYTQPDAFCSFAKRRKNESM